MKKLAIILAVLSLSYSAHASVVFNHKIGTTTINYILPTRLNKGLVGYWSFDGQTIKNGHINDLSGNGNTGYPTNIATSTFYTSGKIGQGVRFDGVNQYVQSNNFNLTSSNGSVTACVWAFSNNFSQRAELIEKEPLNADWSLLLETAGTQGLKLRGSSQLGPVLGFSFITNNRWHHICGTISGTTGTIYLDGVNVKTAFVDALSNTTNTLNLGRYSGSGGGYYFNGTLDDVRIYNRALSPAEINALYKMGQATINKTPVNRLNQGLVGYWTFDGKDMNWASGAVADKSGSGNTGYVVSMSTSSSPVAGRLGQGLLFNGANNQIDVSSVSLNVETFSIGFWFKTGDVRDNRIMLEKYSSGATSYPYALRMKIGQIYFLCYDGTGSVSVNTTPKYNDNKWHHFIVTRVKSGPINIYVDGTNVKSGSDNLGNTTNASLIGIGGRPGDATSGINGLIDDVRIYNRALSPQEVKDLYTMGY